MHKDSVQQQLQEPSPFVTVALPGLWSTVRRLDRPVKLFASLVSSRLSVGPLKLTDRCCVPGLLPSLPGLGEGGLQDMQLVARWQPDSVKQYAYSIGRPVMPAAAIM